MSRDQNEFHGLPQDLRISLLVMIFIHLIIFSISK